MVDSLRQPHFDLNYSRPVVNIIAENRDNLDPEVLCLSDAQRSESPLWNFDFPISSLESNSSIGFHNEHAGCHDSVINELLDSEKFSSDLSFSHGLLSVYEQLNEFYTWDDENSPRKNMQFLDAENALCTFEDDWEDENAPPLQPGDYWSGEYCNKMLHSIRFGSGTGALRMLPNRCLPPSAGLANRDEGQLALISGSFPLALSKTAPDGPRLPDSIVSPAPSRANTPPRAT